MLDANCGAHQPRREWDRWDGGAGILPAGAHVGVLLEDVGGLLWSTTDGEGQSCMGERRDCAA